MAKSPELMTAGEIQKAYDRALAKMSATCKALIAAGRGDEKCAETRNMTDPLAVADNAARDAFHAVRDEMARRKRWHGSHKPIRPSRFA